jgi:hypothetical protein
LSIRGVSHAASRKSDERTWLGVVEMVESMPGMERRRVWVSENWPCPETKKRRRPGRTGPPSESS